MKGCIFYGGRRNIIWAEIIVLYPYRRKANHLSFIGANKEGRIAMGELNECDARHEALRVRIDHVESLAEHKSRDLERRLEGLNHLRNEVMTDRSAFLKKEVQDIRNHYVDVRFQQIERLVYIGVGIALALQFVLHYLGGIK